MDKDVFAFSATHIGYNHEKICKVCEDASDYYEDDRMYICVVADGHGSDNYPRTDRGARYAVNAAIKCICEFVEIALPEQVYVDEKEGYPLMTQLSKSILREWYQSVEDNYNKDPLENSELTNVSDKYKNVYLSTDNDNRKIEKAYGCTLIAFAVTDNYSFGLQIGDGRCVVIDQNGDFSEPIPWDEECQLNVTTSICDSDAIDEFRFCILQGIPAAVFCGSDGIDDSYSNSEELYALYRSILDVFAEHGQDVGKNEVKKYLPILTKKGSGDDVSIACIVDNKKISDIAPILKIETQLFKLSTELAVKKQKLETIREQMDMVYKKIRNTSESFQNVQKNRQGFEKLYDQFYKLKKEISQDEIKIRELKNQQIELLYDKEVASFEGESQIIEKEESEELTITSDNKNTDEELIETEASMPNKSAVSKDPYQHEEASERDTVSEHKLETFEIEENLTESNENSKHEEDYIDNPAEQEDNEELAVENNSDGNYIDAKSLSVDGQIKQSDMNVTYDYKKEE